MKHHQNLKDKLVGVSNYVAADVITALKDVTRDAYPVGADVFPVAGDVSITSIILKETIQKPNL